MKIRKYLRLVMGTGILAVILLMGITGTVGVVEAATLNNPRISSDGKVTWDCVYFGNYPQWDDNTEETANAPIKWRVLSVNGNDAFLVADQNLVEKYYNDTYTPVTWETCTIRSWLNGYDSSSNICEKDYRNYNFLNDAFTASEQNAIMTTTVVNADNSDYETSGGDHTKDKVFLLSYDEVTNPQYGLASACARERKSIGNTDGWWLRSPGNNSCSAMYVNDHGYVHQIGDSVDSCDHAVCPALHLNLSYSTSWSYAGTVSCGGDYEYKVLSDGTVEITGYNGAPTKITIPKTLDGKRVTSIGEEAFSGSTDLDNGEDRKGLISVTISEGVTSIGWGDFEFCNSLKNISLPNSIRSIGGYAFGDCSLENISLPNGITYIGKGAFSGCIQLVNIEIPIGVTEIEDVTFQGCEKLIDVKIPNGLTSIGSEAFSDCSSLKSLNLPNSLTSIDDGTFANCNSLDHIDLPNSITYIGTGAFNGCTQLVHIEIPTGVTEISFAIFSGCKGLTDVKIHSGVTRIEGRAFNDCKKLRRVELSNNVREIEGNPFAGCSDLKEIIVDTNNNYYSSQDGVLFNKNKTKLVAYPSGKTEESYIVPNGVTSIEEDAFIACEGVKSVELSESVTEIKYNAFSSDEDFMIEEFVWYDGYTSINSLIIKNPFCKINDEKFTIANAITIYGYQNSTAQTYAKKYGKKFVILKAGETDDKNSNAPTAGTKLTDTKTKAAYTVTEVGSTVAYAGTTDKNATAITIPSTVTIDNITYQVTSVAVNALKGNKKLKKVTVSGNVTNIGSGAFQNCTALKTVKLGSKVETVGSNAFSNCKKLTSLTLGKNVTTINSKAFYKCTALSKVTIPAKVSKIGASAFYGCKKLKTITIKTKKLTSKKVGSKAFKGINAKATIKVPSSKLKAYKKMLKAKGVGAKVKIKK